MFTTLKITNWSGVEELKPVTGMSHQPGKLIAFHKRDLDTGAVMYQDNGRPQLEMFWLASPQPGVQTVKKVEVFNPSGALVDTIMGQPMVEAEAPKAPAKKSPARAPKRKAA